MIVILTRKEVHGYKVNLKYLHLLLVNKTEELLLTFN